MLYMYQHTGEDKYLDAFAATYDWIAGHQVDWRHGGWLTSVDADGITAGDKAHAWKTPYHNGRAVLTCLQVLAQMGHRASAAD